MKPLLFLLVICCFFSCRWEKGKITQSKRPNVVLFISDDQTWMLAAKGGHICSRIMLG